MFDITGNDISLLSDQDLRDLIGRLCEADLCGNNLSPLAVTYGGDQNAPDGGIDVHVNAATAIPSACDIPRSNTGYQVKAEKMLPNKIREEMQPHGSLRASIQDLADCSGAYIIVCSKDSVSGAISKPRLLPPSPAHWAVRCAAQFISTAQTIARIAHLAVPGRSFGLRYRMKSLMLTELCSEPVSRLLTLRMRFLRVEDGRSSASDDTKNLAE